MLDFLNDQQRAAAEQVHGPVAIIAGAGTGKTTTVTRRIAWQVMSGSFSARSILAVTYTDKAAIELRNRLAKLNVRGVEARTFHSTARWILGVLWADYRSGDLPQLMPHKLPLLEPLAQQLPAPDCFRPRRELAQEIEWAKNRRISPEDYLEQLERSGHEQPLRRAEVMRDVFASYEAAKAEAGVWDFEDLLLHLVDLFDEFPEAAARLRKRFQSLTIDEYQDVNPLQQALVTHLIGADQNLCVVGDDYQTIYGFTGASPDYLLDFAQTYRSARIFRLEENYRSTKPVIDLANRLTPALGGYEKYLRTTVQPDLERAEYPVKLNRALTRSAEAAQIAEECMRLHRDHGVPWHEMAILYRINARSSEYEAALARHEIPFVVQSGSFLERHGPKQVFRALKYRAAHRDVQNQVEQAAERAGWRRDGRVKGSDAAQTLQDDLDALVTLAVELNAPTVEHFCAEVRSRYSVNENQRGVELLTLHRAKGLEWEAVFLPRINEKELPFKARMSEANIDEERRLLYVGITRSRRHLQLSFNDESGAPSVFLAELNLVGSEQKLSPKKQKARVTAPLDEEDALTHALRTWRLEESREQEKPAFTIITNRTLAELVHHRPNSLSGLAEISGIGNAKLERYGSILLKIIENHR